MTDEFDVKVFHYRPGQDVIINKEKYAGPDLFLERICLSTDGVLDPVEEDLAKLGELLVELENFDQMAGFTFIIEKKSGLFGKSICSVLDPFNKIHGRLLAAKRLAEQLGCNRRVVLLKGTKLIITDSRNSVDIHNYGVRYRLHRLEARQGKNYVKRVVSNCVGDMKFAISNNKLEHKYKTNLNHLLYQLDVCK